MGITSPLDIIVKIKKTKYMIEFKRYGLYDIDKLSLEDKPNCLETVWRKRLESSFIDFAFLVGWVCLAEIFQRVSASSSNLSRPLGSHKVSQIHYSLAASFNYI